MPGRSDGPTLDTICISCKMNAAILPYHQLPAEHFLAQSSRQLRLMEGSAMRVIHVPVIRVWGGLIGAADQLLHDEGGLNAVHDIRVASQACLAAMCAGSKVGCFDQFWTCKKSGG